jgi:hypothetical protein
VHPYLCVKRSSQVKLLSEAEEGVGVRGRLARQLVDRDPSDARDLLRDERDVGRLVSLPAMRDRSEVRAVGLKDEAVERDRGDGLADGLPPARAASCV